MRLIERVLLYVVAFALAAMLINDGASSTGSGRPAPGNTPRVANTAARSVRPEAAAPRHEPKPAAERPAGSASQDPGAIRVVDSTGRVRIELSVGGNDEPQLVLRRAGGEIAALLGVEQNGETKLILGSSTGGSTEIISSADGSQRIELSGKTGHLLSLVSNSDGSGEVRLRGSEDKIDIALRRKSDDEAELRIRPTGTPGGVTLTGRTDGVAALRLAGADGVTGPSLRCSKTGWLTSRFRESRTRAAPRSSGCRTVCRLSRRGCPTEIPAPAWSRRQTVVP